MTYHTQTRTPVLGFPLIVTCAPPQITLVGRGEFEAREIYRNAGPSIRSVISAVAAYYGIEPWKLLLRRRFVRITKPRQVAMAVVKSRSALSITDIGRRFGGFDHTTVVHAIQVADRNAVAAISALLDEVRTP